MAQIFHKRGDSLLLTNVWRDAAGNAIDITPWTITSQIRGTNFVQNLTVTKTNAIGGVFTCVATAAQTALFPVTDCNEARLFWDIQFVNGTTTVSSDTVQIVVIEDITQ